MELPRRLFKPKETVLCIDSTGWADHITEGHNYIIRGYSRYTLRGWLLVLEKDDTGRSYTAYEDRFRKVEA